MTLTTHAVAGAAVAELFPNHPVLGFIGGFLSHFLLDAIPHWDYKILSNYANPDVAMAQNEQGISSATALKVDSNFYLDLVRIGSDFLLGFALSFIIWHPGGSHEQKIVFIGALAGMLPDFMQFVYTRFPYQPIVALQTFHRFMHAKLKLNNRPIIGITSQILIIIAIVFITKYFLLV
jgi:hypothetical protein